MRLALALLLLAPACEAAPAKKAAGGKSQDKPAVSTATTSLPLFPPTTGPITVALVLERFEGYDKTMNTLAADFRQSVRWDESGTTQTVEGTVEYKKPDRLRLEHRLPESQTVVADGLWLWIWRKETNQVIQAKFEDWKKSDQVAQGLLDFGKYGELLKRYDVFIATVSEPGPDGHRRFELGLKPLAKDKGKTGDFSLRLRVSTRDFFPGDTEMKVGSVSIHSVFEKVRFNPELAEERFRFAPPSGADVFQNFKPPKAGGP